MTMSVVFSGERKSADCVYDIKNHLKNFLNLFMMIGCAGSLLLCLGFLHLQQAAASLHGAAPASPCGGLSCYRTQGLDRVGSVVVTHKLSFAVTCGISPD